MEICHNKSLRIRSARENYFAKEKLALVKYVIFFLKISMFHCVFNGLLYCHFVLETIVAFNCNGRKSVMCNFYFSTSESDNKGFISIGKMI